MPNEPAPEGVKQEWRCFHCGDVFTKRWDAAAHFGADEGKIPACQIKGAEGGLLRALRDAERQADEAIQAMHAESTDAAKAYHSQRCRHSRALIAAEEVGYERGLADGRSLAAQAPAMEKALRDLLEPLGDAFCDEECDAETQLGGYIFGDVMQEAYRKATTLLSQIEGARHG